MSTESRMYFFVMYNLSEIQKGIQAGHAALEYVLEHKDEVDDELIDVWDFIRDHKTFIVLNGGTSSTMEDRAAELEAMGIRFSSFREPDLNHSMSAIAFLVSEEDYNDPDRYETNEVTQYLRQFRLA